LRGNMRSADWRAEGGQIFGSGSQTTIAVFIGVKDPNKAGFTLRYAQTPDGSSRDEKLKIVENSSVDGIDWQPITPNKEGDWLNQRSDDFATEPVIGEKRGRQKKMFKTSSMCLGTRRDAWVQSFDKKRLVDQVLKLGTSYDAARRAFHSGAHAKRGRGEALVTEFLNQNPQYSDSTNIKWSRSLRNSAYQDVQFSFEESRIIPSTIRPFCSQFVYFDLLLNNERS